MKGRTKRDSLQEPDFKPGTSATDVEGIPRERVLFLLILSVAIALRLWHLDWGLPGIYEEAYPFTISWQFWQWGHEGFTLNPHFFNYPAFTFYLHFLAQSIHYGFGHLLGSYPTLAEFRQSYIANPTAFIIIARVIGVLFDCGILVVFYSIARSISSAKVALCAILLIAVNPLQIKQSQLISVDTPLAFFACFAVLSMLRVYKTGSRKWYLLSGLSIGLAAACKYTGALLLPVLLFAHVLRSYSVTGAIISLRILYLVAALALSGIVFIVFNPFILLNFGEFLQGFGFEAYHASYGHLGLNADQSTLSYYLLESLPNNLGWMLTILVGVTMIRFLFSRQRMELIVAAFPCFYMLVLAIWKMRADRYLLPAIPVLILIGSSGLFAFVDYINSYLGKKGSLPRTYQLIGYALAMLLVGISPLWSSIQYHRSFTLPDTRTVTTDWMTTNLPAGTSIAAGPFGINFNTNKYLILPIPFHPVFTDNMAPFYDTRWYEDLEYIIASDYDYGRYAQEPRRYQTFLRFYDTLRASWKLVYEIKPGPERNGPTLWIYGQARSMPNTPFDSELLSGLAAVNDSERVENFAGRLALILSFKGKYLKTEQLLGEVLAVDARNAKARSELANVYYKSGRYQEALPQIEASVEVAPRDINLLVLRGNIMLKLDRVDAAESSFVRVLALDERQEPAYQSLMLIYAQRDDRPKLIEILEKYKNNLPPEKAQLVEAEIRKLKGGP